MPVAMLVSMPRAVLESLPSDGTLDIAYELVCSRDDDYGDYEEDEDEEQQDEDWRHREDLDDRDYRFDRSDRDYNG